MLFDSVMKTLAATVTATASIGSMDPALPFSVFTSQA
jgi:hypothetical protein